MHESECTTDKKYRERLSMLHGPSGVAFVVVQPNVGAIATKFVSCKKLLADLLAIL